VRGGCPAAGKVWSGMKVLVWHCTGYASQSLVVYPAMSSWPKEGSEHLAYTPHGAWHTLLLPSKQPKDPVA